MEQAAKLEQREFFMSGPSRLSSFTHDRGAVETSHAGNFQSASATYVPLNHASVNQLARRSPFKPVLDDV